MILRRFNHRMLTSALPLPLSSKSCVNGALNFLQLPGSNFFARVPNGMFRMQPNRFLSTESDPNENVIVRVEGGIRSIIFNRPEKKNSVNPQMGLTIAQALIEGNADDATNIIVFNGTGEYFTSGMDLSGFKKPKNSDLELEPSKSEKPKTGGSPGIRLYMHSFINCDKPLIALINGPAIGFGVTMLGLFDTVYCSDRATFKTRFGEFGLPPEFCSTYTFPRIMGYAKASQLLMFDQKMNAKEALNCGLVSQVFPDEVFQEEAWKRVREYGKLPIKSLLYSKALVRGRERELLLQICKNEQDMFDPEIAREIKRKFAERAAQNNLTKT